MSILEVLYLILAIGFILLVGAVLAIAYQLFRILQLVRNLAKESKEITKGVKYSIFNILAMILAVFRKRR